DKTNDKHLELCAVLGEYDNAGFPLSYCLLSTASSVEPRKHSDRDMAEIGMSGGFGLRRKCNFAGGTFGRQFVHGYREIYPPRHIILSTLLRSMRLSKKTSAQWEIKPR
ncbi:hypothetical protein BYT27DRAFT_7090256, partial [Phlegmacium glaucopus]